MMYYYQFIFRCSDDTLRKGKVYRCSTYDEKNQYERLKTRYADRIQKEVVTKTFARLEICIPGAYLPPES